MCRKTNPKACVCRFPAIFEDKKPGECRINIFFDFIANRVETTHGSSVWQWIYLHLPSRIWRPCLPAMTPGGRAHWIMKMYRNSTPHSSKNTPDFNQKPVSEKPQAWSQNLPKFNIFTLFLFFKQDFLTRSLLFFVRVEWTHSQETSSQICQSLCNDL